jgi:3-oxoacyl-[acyl-carrier-protein] synthase II
MTNNEIVITGMGVLSPIGIDLETFWTSLCEGRSGLRFLELSDRPGYRGPVGGEVPDFKPKKYVKPRKNIKVMSRDIQLGFVAAALAVEHAQLETGSENRQVDPERFGVTFGAELMGGDAQELLDAIKVGVRDGKHDFQTWGKAAMEKIFPLWMLKYLPNMPACHIGISHDARGPNNSLTLGRGASLGAIIEAVRTIDRGQAEVMISGGSGYRLNPAVLSRARAHQLAEPGEDPTAHPRPFDAERRGSVFGEGGAAFVLETIEHARARGAKPLARVRGFAETSEALAFGRPSTGEAIRRAIRMALESADMDKNELGHVNADGIGGVEEDRVEARAIADELGDVPVTALKGFFGNLGSGTGAVELVASLLSFEHGLVPPTKNHETPDADCPVNVVHQKPLPGTKPTALIMNQMRMGRSFALVLEKV